MYPVGMPIDRLAVNFDVVPGAMVCSETLLGYKCALVFILRKHAHTNKDHHFPPLVKGQPCSHLHYKHLLMSKVLAKPLPHQNLVNFQN